MDRGREPYYILSDDTQRQSGTSAQRNNILAARIVAETIRTTLGPRGMDKLLVDSAGEMIITNDGVTILNEMHIEHPAAKMVVEVARTQENEVGDGTTSAVIIAGEFLKNAERLLDEKIHPAIIINGFRMAEAFAHKSLHELATPIDPSQTQLLKKIAETAMTGKGANSDKVRLAQLVVQAAVNTHSRNQDLDPVRIQKRVGGGTEESRIFDGIVLERERVHPQMPSRVDQAKILLLDSPLELKEADSETRITINDPNQLRSFLDQEEKSISELASKISGTGANVVICQKGIDDLLAYKLSKEGILAVRRVKKSDIERLAMSCSAKIHSSLDDADSSSLGTAKKVEQVRISDQSHIFIEGAVTAKIVTILLRGGTDHVVAELERAVSDALGDVRATLDSGKAVGGAGAVEILLSQKIKEFASSVSGREQAAVLAFAKSYEVIIKTLAENAGYDSIQAVADATANKDNLSWPGFESTDGSIQDAWSRGIIEPIQVKLQALSSAVDVACMILRIDDVIAAGPMDQVPDSAER